PTGVRVSCIPIDLRPHFFPEVLAAIFTGFFRAFKATDLLSFLGRGPDAGPASPSRCPSSTESLRLLTGF
ncbi:hypothetical protein Pmar_PMAR029156, partial [Perkinsus marinus ATCC 50983]